MKTLSDSLSRSLNTLLETNDERLLEVLNPGEF